MSVPTHNLYDFVHQTTKRRFWLMYFSPWGSRDFDNLISYQEICSGGRATMDQMDGPTGIPLLNRFDFQKFNTVVDYNKCDSDLIKWTQPILICHDQEPLSIDYFNANSTITTECTDHGMRFKYNPKIKNVHCSVNKKSILLHSEINSSNLLELEKTDFFVGAYWWSHAVIARDWYRYAEHDSSLITTGNTRKQLFLTYSRDLTGSRLYRGEFIEKIKKFDLINDCRRQSDHYEFLQPHLSAEYNSTDIIETAFSIVLETIFDDRIHLTEKTLRPLACGHPFILANGPGSLELLKKYGFKTFHPYINEEYDQVTDNNQRLNYIVAEMCRIKSLDHVQLSQLLNQCKEITEHNKKWFFSTEFLNIVVTELVENTDYAYNKILEEEQYTTANFLLIRREIKKNKIVIEKNYNKKILIKLIREIRKFLKSKV